MKAKKSSGKPTAKRATKDLLPKTTSDVEGGNKNESAAAKGNVAAKWSLTQGAST